MLRRERRGQPIFDEGSDGRKMDSKSRMDLFDKIVDRNWYLRAYRDVERAAIDPLVHYVEYGEMEGRSPNGLIEHNWIAHEYGQGKLDTSSPIEWLLRTPESDVDWLNPCVSITYLRARWNVRGSTADIIEILLGADAPDQTCSWFSQSDYVDANPDLAGLASPLQHFLEQGLMEGRSPGPGLALEACEDGNDSGRETVGDFNWSGGRYRIVRKGPPRGVLCLVRDLAEIEPRLLPMTLAGLPRLPTYRADDLSTRDNLDVDSLSEVVAWKPDVIIAIPALRIGGAEKYALSLAAELVRQFGWRVAILVTEYASDEAVSREITRAHNGLLGVFDLSCVLGAAWEPARALAGLVLVSRPRLSISINADAGYACFRRYGLGLGNRTQLVSCFFSEAPASLAVSYSARFAVDVAKTTVLLTDNNAWLAKIRQRVIQAHEVGRAFVVPPLAVHSEDTIDESERWASWGSRRPRRWLWMSRWDQWKGTIEVLAAAALTPNAHWTLYTTSVDVPERDMPSNVQVLGTSLTVDSVPVGDFDAFVFTSYFEGMPNIVLEMALRGIPIVSPRVGGLHETFPDDALTYFDPAPGSKNFVKALAVTLEQLWSTDVEVIRARSVKARECVIARHGHVAFARSVEAFVQGMGLANDDG